MVKKKTIKNKNNKKFAIMIFRIISLIIIIVCLAILNDWHKNNKENISVIKELEDYAIITQIEENENLENNDNIETENKLVVNFEELKLKNNDTIGWIKIDNTNINFPIVQTDDNNYYLKHNFNKEQNGAGWIFADYRCNFDSLSKNTIIYGHNRRNGTMFSNLSYMIDDDWNFEDNSYFNFSTTTKSYKAEIFSVYVRKATELTIPNEFSNNLEFENYINSIKSLSIYNFNIQIFDEDNIITLCTCDNTSKNRIVVHAKLVEQ